MNSALRIAVIDVGKTNAKLVIVDGETGKELAARTTPNRVIATAPYPHYDVDRLWAFFLSALKEFAREPGIDAISVTTHGASAALLGEDGLAMPVLDYEHIYPDAIQKAYRALRPDFAETCSPPLTGGLNLGAQIHFQKTGFPDLFAKVRTIVTYPQYWVWRLTGNAVNEVTSLGCHSDLWRPREGVFSSLTDRMELRSLMAPVRSSFDSIGSLLPEIADHIGVDKPVPVHCGMHDSNASLLPHLTDRKAPFSVVSTGTWVISFAVGGQFDRLDPARDTLANVDAYGRAVPSSRFMGGREFDTLTQGEPVEPDEEALYRVIDGRIMVLPSIATGTGPYPNRIASWPNGKPINHAERTAAASLYVALMNNVSLGLIGADGPTIVEGPLARNAIYVAALQNLTGRPVIAVPGSTGTSHGAALLAGARIAPPRESPSTLTLPAAFTNYAAAWDRALQEK
ncbi:MAG: FGGY-family carbohydrate kinase [Phyllobacterium sp.]